MNPDNDSLWVFVISLVLYVLVPVFLLYRHWPFRAGLAMLVIAFLPISWQAWFTDSDSPAFVFLLIPMLPIPFVLMAAGVLQTILRAVRPRRRRVEPIRFT